ncbi:MAG: hypothetical protein E7234_03075 [Lachnospiraceae bacterium]|jgi:hypothetical protein|nr:hypothetical protein [Lachnospiraceae bacterium]
MILEFTEDDIKTGKNTVFLEDMVFKAITVEGSGSKFNLKGIAVIDGEVYNDFQMEVILTEEITPKFPADVLEAEWEEYEFLF